jgi:serine/threonine-protein kinase ATR
MTDIIRRTTEAARSIFDYCLSPCCSTTSIKRARSLSRIVTATASLLSFSTGFESALGNLIYRLVLYRLQQGPRVGWESVDIALRHIFDAPLDVLPLGQNVVPALDILRTENWGDAGKDLRVSLSMS